MKKVLALLFATLVMVSGTCFASMGEFAIDRQEIDLSVLMGMPGFCVEYGEDDALQWIAYEDQESLVDAHGCYVIPTITVLQTAMGGVRG